MTTPDANSQIADAKIDASCRVPLLALFGGAALWLIVGLVLALIASIKFHKPEFLADCSLLTYGHVQAAANDLILYGFAIPAALGVILWIFARLSRAELVLPLVPVVAANIWHVGVLIGTIGILAGNSTGFAWLEYPRLAFSAVARRIYFDCRFRPSPPLANVRNASFIRRIGFCSPRCYGSRGFIPRPIFSSSSGPCAASRKAVINLVVRE